MKKNYLIFVVLTLFIALLLTKQTWALTQYNISSSLDLSGPYADICKSASNYQDIFLTWWNEEIGKEIGLGLNVKVHDSRYDPTVVASYWPGVLSSAKPIAHMGFGGADVAALMKRLPQDKVPMINPTGTYGYIWKPNQWVFQTRPTYPHECAGFASFLWDKLNRNIRVGSVVAKGHAAHEDIADGIKNWCKKANWVDLAGVEYTNITPVSLLNEIQRLITRKPDYIYCPGSVSQNVATVRALKQLGSSVPPVMSQHNSLMTTAKALSVKDLEAYYDCAAVDPGMDKTIPAYKIFKKYLSVAPGVEWSANAVFWSSQVVLTCRAIERAAKMVGPDKITGEAVYNAMFTSPFTQEDLLGMLPTLTFTKDSPFSEGSIKVKVTTIENGKHVMATDGWVPLKGHFPKW